MRPADFAAGGLLRSEILVCVGCGGVGKTTVAAALALEAARRGRRVLVLTIDPAHRLADALGVEALGNRPQALPAADLARLGVPQHASLSALMLDMKRTFDDLVERFAESADARERVFSNPIYQHASAALAGSVEYSAMEKVFELHETGAFDLIVVDTPPAQHALDFLEAPERLLEFLDSRMVQMLIHPAFAAGRVGFRLFQRGTRRILQQLERVSGLGFLEDVSEFLLAFEHMAGGFRERARRVSSLLLGPTSAFVLVSSPATESVRNASRFLDRLEAHRVPLAGVLVNRVRLWPEGDPPAGPLAPDARDLARLADALRASEGPGFPAEEAARAAVEAASGYAQLVRQDESAVRPLRERTEAGTVELRHPREHATDTSERFWGCIPELDADVHDLDGLGRVADLITGAVPHSTHERRR